MGSLSGGGALGGAAQGASIGSAAGPWGALVGGVIGGLGGLFSGGRGPQYDPVTENLASFSRANWQAAAALQYPIEQQLINFAEDPTYAGRQAQKAENDVTQQFDILKQNQIQQQRFQGLQLTPEQEQAQNTAQALGETAAIVGARNRASQTAYATQRTILGG